MLFVNDIVKPLIENKVTWRVLPNQSDRRWSAQPSRLHLPLIHKNLCGRDGRTICGPQCVPKSTSVTLAVDEKTLPMATLTGRTDRQTARRTDRRTDRQTECDAICGPLLGRRAAC